MSTHSHEVVTDVKGVMPRFLQEFHRLLALVPALALVASACGAETDLPEGEAPRACLRGAG